MIKKFLPLIFACLILLAGCGKENVVHNPNNILNDDAIDGIQYEVENMAENHDETEPAKEEKNQFPNIPYNHVGRFSFSPAPLFEVVSDENRHEQDADLALNAIKESMGTSDFYFYVVDENEKFLGKGSKTGYTPYVFSLNDPVDGKPPYSVPFTYYMSKYFSDIDYENYSYKSYYNTSKGYKQCEFTIITDSEKDYKAIEIATQKILKLMKLTMSDQPVTIHINAEVGSKDINIRTYDPEKDGENETKTLVKQKSKF